MKKAGLILTTILGLSSIFGCSTESNLLQVDPQVNPALVQSSSVKEKAKIGDLIAKYLVAKQDLIAMGDKVTVIMFNAQGNDKKLIHAYFKKALTTDKRKFRITDADPKSMRPDLSEVAIFATAKDGNNFAAYVEKLIKAE